MSLIRYEKPLASGSQSESKYCSRSDTQAECPAFPGAQRLLAFTAGNAASVAGKVDVFLTKTVGGLGRGQG